MLLAFPLEEVLKKIQNQNALYYPTSTEIQMMREGAPLDITDMCRDVIFNTVQNYFMSVQGDNASASNESAEAQSETINIEEDNEKVISDIKFETVYVKEEYRIDSDENDRDVEDACDRSAVRCNTTKGVPDKANSNVKNTKPSVSKEDIPTSWEEFRKKNGKPRKKTVIFFE